MCGGCSRICYHFASPTLNAEPLSTVHCPLCSLLHCNSATFSGSLTLAPVSLASHHHTLYCFAAYHPTFPVSYVFCLDVLLSLILVLLVLLLSTEAIPSTNRVTFTTSQPTLRLNILILVSTPLTKLNWNTVTRQADQVSISPTPKSPTTLVSRKADRYRPITANPP